jgi:hypothetical protein
MFGGKPMIVSEAAEFCRVSVPTLRRLLRRTLGD